MTGVQTCALPISNISIYQLNVTPLGSNVTIYINGSSENASITSGDSIWLNATLITGGSGNIELYNNQSLINNATSSPAVNLTTFTGIGDYNITGHYFGNENYSENWSYSFYVNVTSALDTEYPQFSNYYDNNATYSGEYARFNVTVESTNGTVFLTLNGTNYTAYNLTSNIYNVTTNLTIIVEDRKSVV